MKLRRDFILQMMQDNPQRMQAPTAVGRGLHPLGIVYRQKGQDGFALWEDFLLEKVGLGAMGGAMGERLLAWNFAQIFLIFCPQFGKFVGCFGGSGSGGGTCATGGVRLVGSCRNRPLNHVPKTFL